MINLGKNLFKFSELGAFEFGNPIWLHWRCSGVFIFNFEHISHLVLVFLFLTLNM